MSVNTPLIGTFTALGVPVANGVLSFVLTNCGGTPTFGTLTPGPFTLSAGGVLSADVAGNQATGCTEVSAGVNNSYYEISLHDSSGAMQWRRYYQIPVQTAAFNLATAIPVSPLPAPVLKSGAPGAAATITVGSVTELASGDPPTIVNEGTSTAAVFDFGLPAGGGGGGGGTPVAPAGVLSLSTSDPSTLSPFNGDAYLLLTGAVGLWTGHLNSVAVWSSSTSTWSFFAPQLGQLLYSEDIALYLTYDGTAWGLFGGGLAAQPTASQGINQPAGTTFGINVASVSGDGATFDIFDSSIGLQADNIGIEGGLSLQAGRVITADIEIGGDNTPNKAVMYQIDASSNNINIQIGDYGTNLVIFKRQDTTPSAFVVTLSVITSNTGEVISQGFDGLTEFITLANTESITLLPTPSTQGFAFSTMSIVARVTAASSGSGSVTSVGMTVPSRFTVTGSPVTGAGTLAVTENAAAANTVLRGPVSGAAAAPTFGAIVPADLPVASSSDFGAVKVDGTTVVATAGVLSAPGNLKLVSATPQTIVQGPGASLTVVAQASSTVPGEIVFQATSTAGGNAGLVQFNSGIFLFNGLAFDAYERLTTSKTLTSMEGASYFPIDATSGNVTITLPNTVNVIGTSIPTDSMFVGAVRLDSSANTVTLAAVSPTTINGVASITLVPNQAVSLLCITNPSTNIQNWQIVGSTSVAGGSGTVTSVAVTVPSRQTVTGSPVTAAGTLAITDNTQSANTFFGGPSTGAAAGPVFRSLVAADVPVLNQSTTGNASTSTLAATAVTANAVDGVVVTGVPTTGQVITATGAAAATWQTPSGGPVAEAANMVYAGPISGSSLLPTFRALTVSDMPATGIAPAFVQGASAAAASVSPTSLPCAFTSANTLGNLLIIALQCNVATAGTIVITDSQGNTYTTVHTNGSSGYTALYYAPNCKAGANTVTVTFTGTTFNGGACVAIQEYSGIAAVPVVDATAFVSGSGLASVSTSAPSDLIFAMAGDYAVTSLSMSGSYTARETTFKTGGANSLCIATWDQVGIAPGVYSGATVAPNSQIMVIAFKAAVAGGYIGSIALTMPADFTVSGSPLTTGGTLAITQNVQPANAVHIGPVTGSPALPTYRVLTVADLPTSLGVGTAVLEIDGAGSVPTLGAKGFIQIPYNGTITGWTLMSDVSGSAQVTVSKGTYATYPTVSSIDALLPPVLSGAQKNTTTVLTGWTTAITAGDILTFNLDSVSTLTRLKLELFITKG